MVWLSSVQSSKELRFTIWCIAVYFLSSVYFTDGSMKNAVYSLFSFSPIVASFYVFEKTRNLKEGEIERDVQRAIQFFCVFGCIAYQRLYQIEHDESRHIRFYCCIHCIFYIDFDKELS